MRFDVLTLFPAAFTGPLDVSIIKRAREDDLVEIQIHDIRDHATGKHRSVDDYPFGGGQGMVIRVDVLDAALQHVRALDPAPPIVVYLTPQGARLDDALVRELATHPRLILVCGRYEGVDERFIQHRVDRQVSIGDYILTGGELPAMVLIDAVARHVPDVLGDEASPQDESFVDGLLEHAQYTRPAEYNGWTVPDVLLGGDHASIERWRREQRVARTVARRPDLLPVLEDGEKAELQKIGVPGARLRSLHYPADLPAVLALWRAQHGAIKLGPSDTPIELAKLIERNPGLFLVVEVSREIVAAVMAGFDGRRGYVYHLAVASDHRGKGIAAALMAELERRLRARGCLRLNLFVQHGPDSAAAAAFYERHGWARIEAQGFAKTLQR